MIKKIAWETFKNTGDVNTFLEFKQFQIVEEKLKNKEIIDNNSEHIQKVEQYGDNKNEWNHNLCKKFRRLW